jgi:hypothetical protein
MLQLLTDLKGLKFCAWLGAGEINENGDVIHFDIHDAVGLKKSWFKMFLAGDDRTKITNILTLF